MLHSRALAAWGFLLRGRHASAMGQHVLLVCPPSSLRSQSFAQRATRNTSNRPHLRLQYIAKTKSQTRVVTTTSFDSIYVPVHTTDTIYLNDKWMPVYSFRDTSEFYTIAGRVSPESALLEKISFPNTITFSQRWERKKLLSKKTYFVEVENTNPYVQIQGVQNYEIRDESWFWEKNKFWFAIGAGAGFLIAK